MKSLVLAVSASLGTCGLAASAGCSHAGSAGAGADRGGIGGSAGQSGSLVTVGNGGGLVVTSSDAGAGSGTSGTVVTIDRTRGKVPDDVVGKLMRGSGSTGGMAFLYPYEGTVFPGGILPPLIQWTAAGPMDGVYLHIASKAFDYKEIFAGLAAPQLELGQDAWDLAAQQSQGATDPTLVELTTIAGGAVTGPIAQHWIFARGQLKSAVYYNTYNSAKTAPNNGAVMRILPLAREPEVVKTVAGGFVPLGPCYSCHSLSANGQMLVAQRHQYPGGPYSSNSFDLAANGRPDPAPLATSAMGAEDWGFSAVYPDGSKLLTAAQPAAAGGFPFPFAPLNNPGMLGPRAAKLFDTRTGAEVPSTGLVPNAKMPAFSPDGKKLVFNDHDDGQGHSLSVMDFDSATNTFANRTEIFRDPALFPGWPFFTPDGLEVVFALGNGSDYATIQDPPTGLTVNRSDLYVVDLRHHSARALDLANGQNLGPRDQHLDFYPTISPVATGGYFWVFFTSRRTYGNVMTRPETDPVTKKIWAFAISIDGGDGSSAPTGDPSHPAFYLPGQELQAGNIRAFATLTPCQTDGTRCSSGLDCCGGFCIDGVCGTGKPRCANVDDRCAVDADCCQAGKPLTCIGGYCTAPVVVR